MHFITHTELSCSSNKIIDVVLNIIDNIIAFNGNCCFLLLFFAAAAAVVCFWCGVVLYLEKPPQDKKTR